MRLQDQVILVTGSTTGIGEAIARRFVAEGARVMLHGRDRLRGEEVAASLGDRAALCCDDLADPHAGERIVKATLEAFGKIDAVVNNAALIVRSDLNDTTPELFHRSMTVNVLAPLMLIRAALTELKKSRGAVLNIGSINAYCGESNLLAYSISKGGLMTLSRNLADALRTEVRVNHFNVGWTLTPNEYTTKIKDGLPPGWPEQVPASQAPSGRLLRPEEIAAAAVHWVSPESYPISGSVIEIEQFPVIGRNPVKKGDGQQQQVD